jgi:hypothetical protein
VRRRRRPPEPLPDWLVDYSDAEWIRAEDLEGEPRYPAGGPMSLEEVAYRRYREATRGWLIDHGYDLVDSLRVMRAIRLKKPFPDDIGPREDD